MAKALGLTPEDEISDGIHQISQILNGNVGLMFSNTKPEDILGFFNTFTQQDYARMGNVATQTVTIPAGPVLVNGEPFSHTLEVQARSLGLPSRLKDGIVSLTKEYTICKEGETLTADQAKLLKMFYVQMATFKVSIVAYWNNGKLSRLQE